jgi:hypothetical protein
VPPSRFEIGLEENEFDPFDSLESPFIRDRPHCNQQPKPNGKNKIATKMTDDDEPMS